MKALFRLIITALTFSAATAAWAEPLRLGISSASARGQYALLEEWRAYLQAGLAQPVEFVFRESYFENIDLLKQKKLDFAWSSSPAYFENMNKTRLLVTPLYKGQPFDSAYLIVPASDQTTNSLSALEDKVFAYVDPDSNAGYLEIRYRIRLAGRHPERFFKKTFFTHDEQKIVAAVAIGLADAGAMSGFAWERLARSHPEISAQTRIVSKSPPYGFPPIIARSTLSKHNFDAMQKALTGMSNDPAGIRLLQRLNIDGFIAADKKIYGSVYKMMLRTGDL